MQECRQTKWKSTKLGAPHIRHRCGVQAVERLVRGRYSLVHRGRCRCSCGAKRRRARELD